MGANVLRNKFDYYPVPGHKPNVYFEWSKSSGVLPATTRVYAWPEADIVIQKLSLRHPDWAFILTRSRSVNGALEAQSCNIFKGTEWLGCFSPDYHGRFAIDCPRLLKNRQRGSATYTRDALKAIKIIESNFGPKVTSEVLEDAVTVANRCLQEKYGSTKYALEKLKSAMIPVLLDYAIGNWDTMLPYLKQSVVDVTQYPYVSEKALKSHRMCKTVNYGGAYFILLQDNKYVVAPTGRDQDWRSLKAYTDDDLPDKLKVSLGLLKLTDERKVLDDVGLRVSKDVFFIVEPET